MKNILLLFLLLSLFPIKAMANGLPYEQLEKLVIRNNQNGKANESLRLIIDFIEDNKDDHYYHCKALILKSDTYKSLFNYSETLKVLDKAYKIGLKSNKINEVKATITLERAYAFFDLLKYDQANKLMQELKKDNYKHIEPSDIAGMIMQEAYIDYLNKDYIDAEKKYDDALLLMEKANPKNLPIIYGKKMELYLKTKERDKAIHAFKLGLSSAEKHHILKYKIYMYEKLREQQMQDNDWKNAFRSFQIIDAMNIAYNADNKSNQLKILEKDKEIQKQEFDLKRSNLITGFLFVVCLLSFVGLFLFYQFLKSNKEKNLLLEKENVRIHDELQILSSSLSTHGFTKIDLSAFKLTERQFEIIELIRQGKTNKEIANTIFISENTVKYHLKVIYDIMNIENRSEFLKLININNIKVIS
ncbi:helix-turn-helix transcriptional regulator [Flavobacterium sp.]|uniref:tetratricopeptide repeat protein n=1 Tax=Flavobacterium sp. TaxID=239 RepID=UPI00261F244C|nr:helix-turn-helix transcriptional regulator [Flavobacterium sp.]